FAMVLAVRFSYRDLSTQYVTRGISILMIGVVGGSLLATSFGESIGGMVMASFGIEALTFVSHPFIYLGFPALMLLVTLLATKLGTNQAGKMAIVENIKE